MSDKRKIIELPKKETAEYTICPFMGMHAVPTPGPVQGTMDLKMVPSPCAKERCVMWDKDEEGCMIPSAFESLMVIADALDEPGDPGDEAVERHYEEYSDDDDDDEEEDEDEDDDAA